ncbi:hypothetical protein HK405_010935, partial [Cladochytrium tenue]
QQAIQRQIEAVLHEMARLNQQQVELQAQSSSDPGAGPSAKAAQVPALLGRSQSMHTATTALATAPPPIPLPLRHPSDSAVAFATTTADLAAMSPQTPSTTRFSVASSAWAGSQASAAAASRYSVAVSAVAAATTATIPVSPHSPTVPSPLSPSRMPSWNGGGSSASILPTALVQRQHSVVGSVSGNSAELDDGRGRQEAFNGHLQQDQQPHQHQHQSKLAEQLSMLDNILSQANAYSNMPLPPMAPRDSTVPAADHASVLNSPTVSFGGNDASVSSAKFGLSPSNTAVGSPYLQHSLSLNIPGHQASGDQRRRQSKHHFLEHDGTLAQSAMQPGSEQSSPSLPRPQSGLHVGVVPTPTPTGSLAPAASGPVPSSPASAAPPQTPTHSDPHTVPSVSSPRPRSSTLASSGASVAADAPAPLPLPEVLHEIQLRVARSQPNLQLLDGFLAGPMPGDHYHSHASTSPLVVTASFADLTPIAAGLRPHTLLLWNRRVLFFAGLHPPPHQQPAASLLLDARSAAHVAENGVWRFVVSGEDEVAVAADAARNWVRLAGTSPAAAVVVAAARRPLARWEVQADGRESMIAWLDAVRAVIARAREEEREAADVMRAVEEAKRLRLGASATADAGDAADEDESAVSSPADGAGGSGRSKAAAILGLGASSGTNDGGSGGAPRRSSTTVPVVAATTAVAVAAEPERGVFATDDELLADMVLGATEAAATPGSPAAAAQLSRHASSASKAAEILGLPTRRRQRAGRAAAAAAAAGDSSPPPRPRSRSAAAVGRNGVGAESAPTPEVPDDDGPPVSGFSGGRKAAKLLGLAAGGSSGGAGVAAGRRPGDAAGDDAADSGRGTPTPRASRGLLSGLTAGVGGGASRSKSLVARGSRSFGGGARGSSGRATTPAPLPDPVPAGEDLEKSWAARFS